ncbi:MAG: helix-turn-helix domain-containing protein [Flavobacteriaceae bacterium]
MKKVVYELTEENMIHFTNIIFSKARKENDQKEDKFMTLDELASYIDYKKTSIYGLVQKNKIPYHKKGKLYFLKSEIDEWLKNGKKTTADDIQKKADEYLRKNKLI